MREERLATHERRAVTQTTVRTRILLTQPLIVTLRTLRPAVTQLVRADADVRVQTAVVACTLSVLTPVLVLAALAVVVAVTARKHRQADGQGARTAVVGVGTSGVFSQWLYGDITLPKNGHNENTSLL
jgi:hypothetical protein